MKKTFFLLIMLAGVLTAQAQVSDNATVNVKLYPIQTIVVNPDNKVVNLDYQTTTDYQDGVNVDKKDHLKIYSTGGFEVNVSAAGDLTSSDATKNISAADIKITASAGTVNPLTSTTSNTYKSINLSNTNQLLVDNATGGVNKTVSVNYAAAGADAYVDKFINGENPTVYTTTVTYTISPK